ncbi:hypothetical protein ACFWPA_04235 [Rhodococcus sp. NPDC058505]|uniref:hypothetical protein n=1 Tax=unclassified Rhodococcus (in: high G+C Gram-positive bacteria) TaxID=192944 RepID=UPI00365DD0DA
MTRRNLKSALAAGAVAGAALLAAPGIAGADTLSGWVGATLPVNGNLLLHQSTIINDPNLVAQSKVWTVAGNDVAPAGLGARARLFKSGALCQAIDYRYNVRPAPQMMVGTTAVCGTGWYNSHGFVAAWDGVSTYKEYVTFPTDPLYFDVPAPLSARAQVAETIDIETGTNNRGQSFGSGEGIDADADLPDLIAAIGSNGEIGYIHKDALGGPAATPEQALATDPGARTVPLYDTDGTTVIGEFAVS